jgi:hypothetical protein
MCHLQVKDRLQLVWASWRTLTPEQQRAWAEKQLGKHTPDATTAAHMRLAGCVREPIHCFDMSVLVMCAGERPLSCEEVHSPDGAARMQAFLNQPLPTLGASWVQPTGLHHEQASKHPNQLK